MFYQKKLGLNTSNVHQKQEKDFLYCALDPKISARDGLASSNWIFGFTSELTLNISNSLIENLL